MPLTICPKCKGSVSPDERSCRQCGAPIGDADEAAKRRTIAEEEKRSRKTFRTWCVVVMFLGIITWFAGLVTVSFMFMIVGGATAVAAGCGLVMDRLD